MSKATTTTLRQGAWNAAARRKLSASLHPHKSDPPEMLHNAESAISAFDAMQASTYTSKEAFSAILTLPDTLTVESEQERQRMLSSWVGVSWRGAGRAFSSEYWNPLIGLWVDRLGLDFALKMLLPDPKAPETHKLPHVHSSEEAWIGMRRYLCAASDEDFQRALDYAHPTLELITGSFEDIELREHILLAFSRDPQWSARVLKGVVAGTHNLHPCYTDTIAATSPDTELVLDAAHTCKMSMNGIASYFVFDITEQHGSQATRIFDLCKPRRADDKKRVEAARSIAQKLAPLGY